MSAFSIDLRHARISAVRGFTLIEVLVVIVILSISVSLIVVNLTRDERTVLENEARRLALILEFSRDEAILGGQPLAWTANLDGYTVARKQHRGQRKKLDADSISISHAWSQSAKLAAQRVAGMPSAVGDPLVFSTSGINLPYELVLAAGSWRVTLSGDIAGKVRIAPPIRDAAKQP